MQKCPGSDNRMVGSEYRICDDCGEHIEFFSDEMVRYCPNCHSRQTKETDPVCAAWCPAAEACIGDPVKLRQIKEKAEKETSKEDKERIIQLIEKVRNRKT